MGNPDGPRPRRAQSEVLGTPRSAARSLWRSQRTPKVPGKRLGRRTFDFLTKQIWPWIVHYLALVFTPRRRFPTYRDPPSRRPGIYPMPEACSIGLAADWGTGTDSAYRVADLLRARHPDFTIHMGDVYYSGTEQEYRDYFLGEDEWPRGRLGTYVLNGNHEMYSGGAGYFGVALPTLGQETSYFCLANQYWRIVAVDTGYYARTVPLLELLLRRWIRLPSPTRRWLDEVVFADATDSRPVILLSHHQWFSAFEAGYSTVGSNLAPFLDRVLLWLWGHEHRFAAYAPFGLHGAPRVRARCIGHGGMPIEIGKTPGFERNLVCYDQRQATTVENAPIGYCGFAVLHLNGPELELEYVDEHRVTVLTERWTRRPEGVKGEIVHALPLLTVIPPKTFASLVEP